MKQRQYTRSISFVTTDKMYNIIKTLSDEREIGLSDLMREALEQYLEKIAATENTRRNPCPTDIQN